MTDGGQDVLRWSQFVMATLITIVAAVIVVWTWRSYGRSVGFAFAFGVNWILMAWAIGLGRVLESPHGAWNGLSIRLPESYYVTRPFEKGGHVYDYLGVRWYQRSHLWNWRVNPSLLRSQPGARQTIVRSTRDAEAGHLVIFVVIVGITSWALFFGGWTTAAWLLLFNLLHNGYPVLSMRQIRARLDRPSKRLQQTVMDRVPSHEGQRTAAEPEHDAQ